jgi:hypothetical protein
MIMPEYFYIQSTLECFGDNQERRWHVWQGSNPRDYASLDYVAPVRIATFRYENDAVAWVATEQAKREI